MGATDIYDELGSIQALLGRGGEAPPAAGAKAPAPAAPQLPRQVPTCDDADTEDSEEDALPPIKTRQSPSKRQASLTAPLTAAQSRELQREVAELRQQATAGDDRCRRLEEALVATQRDAGLLTQRLQTQLQAKQEESTQLAELVFQLREEADVLRHQLQRSTRQAEESDRAAMGSVAQLQEAAAEWRRQGEDSLEALAQERSHRTALEHEVQRLQGQAEELQRALGEERRQRETAAAEAKAAGGSASLVAELRQRVAMEKSWRKAVCQWIQGEISKRNDLERVLLNVGTSLRVGDVNSPGGRQAVVPPLPPRRMAASQLVPQAAGQKEASASAVTVTVLHSPGTVPACGIATDASAAAGGGAQQGSKSKGDWRQHYKATIEAFDERHTRLQQEMSTLRREALQVAT